jgi:regulator of replication initiation timing
MELDLQEVIKAVVGMGQQVMVNKEAIEVIVDEVDSQIKQNKALKKQLNTLKKQFNDSKKKKKKEKKSTQTELG